MRWSGRSPASPELHDPVRGRIRGAGPSRRSSPRRAPGSDGATPVEDVEHVVAERHGFEEVVLHLDGQNGRVDLPVAIVADRRPDGRIEELRLYFSSWPLAGRHANRPPLLQPDPDLRVPDVVGEYQRALAAGDARGDRGGVRTGRLRARARRRRARPRGPRRPARVLRAGCSRTAAASRWSTAR